MKGTETRSSKTIRNSFTGVIMQLITALTTFICRTFFIKILGVEYLGISGLFANILTLLALSDLGVYTVMVFSLYKPISEKQYDKIATLIKYYQKLYAFIALTVLVLGLLCVPLLPYLVKDSALSYSKLVLYYLLLLGNTVCSYVAIAKSTLLRADQNAYVVQIATGVSTVFMNVAQVVVLYFTRRYVFFLVVQMAFTLGVNIVLSWIAQRKYPYLKKFTPYDISSEKKGIFHNLKATLLYKLGNAILNSTDNILISVLLGTVVVGYYSNYVMIFSMVNTFIMVLIQSVLASIGNFYAEKDAEEKRSLFECLLFVFYGIGAFCAGCYIAIMNDFITLWVGKEFVITGGFIYALAFYRLVFCCVHPIWMIRESAGLFIATKYEMMIAAFINIVLSVVLGLWLGISGIILATAIAYLTTVFWYEPKQTYQKVFGCSVKSYCSRVCKLLLVVAPILGVSALLQFWKTTNLFFMLCKVGICGLTVVSLFLIFFGRSAEFKRFKRFLTGMLRRKRKGDA